MTTATHKTTEGLLAFLETTKLTGPYGRAARQRMKAQGWDISREGVKLARRWRKAVTIIREAIAAVGDEGVSREAHIFFDHDGRLCFGFDGAAFWAFGDSGYDYSAHNRLDRLCQALAPLGFHTERDDNVTLKLF